MTSHTLSPEPQRVHTVYACGDVEVDIDTRIAHVAGRRAMLTFAEFETLARLMEDPGRVLSREALRVFPSARLRAVDVHITRIRRKLASAKHLAIEAVPHIGYRCCDPSGYEPAPLGGDASFD